MAISEIDFEMESSCDSNISTSASLKSKDTNSNSFESLRFSELEDSESNELFASLASIQECERYFESKNMKDDRELSFRNSFSGFLSSQNNSAIKHSSSRIDSDHSSKRFKSSASETISFLISEEDSENKLNSQSKVYVSPLRDEEDIDKVRPEVLTNSKESSKSSCIKSSQNHCDENTVTSCVIQEHDCAIGNNKNGAKFLCELISSLSSASQQEDLAITENSNKIIIDMKEQLRIDCLNIHSDDKENFVSKKEQNKECISEKNNLKLEMHNFADSGFVTGKNKKIYVKPEAIEVNKALFYDDSGISGDQIPNTQPENKLLCESMLNQDKECNEKSIRNDKIENTANDSSEGKPNKTDDITIAPGYIDSGFKTGNNKKILVIENFSKKEDKNFTGDQNIPEHRPMRRYNIPEKSHTSVEVRDDIGMTEVYNKVKKEFKKEDSRWVHEQFKWCWMHLFVNQMINCETLENEIISLMKFKLRSEYSILRRIVEFDDLSLRFMVLGIIGYGEDSIELFDGFYSLIFEIDKNIFSRLKQAKADLGTKLYVFGSSLLLKSSTDIFDVKGCCMKLHFNSMRICLDDSALGKSNKISFLNKISCLRSDGGVVSALVVKVKRIVELKYLVTVENYRNRVENLEAEIEKIYEIARKADFVIDPKKILCKQFCKMIIADDSGECLLTWWSPPEIRVSDVYKFVYLIPVENSMGLHLSTSNRTFYEKVKS